MLFLSCWKIQTIVFFGHLITDGNWTERSLIFICNHMQFGINQKQKKNPKKIQKKNFGINQHKAYQIAWACWSSASVVFEKSMSADLFQFAQENSCDYYYILCNNYIFLFPVNQFNFNFLLSILTFCPQF